VCQVNCPEEEEQIDHSYNSTFTAHWLSVAWGILHLWMTVFGVYIYTWYPYLIQNNTWW
jgi:hypothetical protein